MAYLYYTYCDHNSSALLPYIKATYHGSLALQQEAYWWGRKEQYQRISDDKYLSSSVALTLSSSSSDNSLNEKPFETKKAKKYEMRRNTAVRTYRENLSSFSVLTTSLHARYPFPLELESASGTVYCSHRCYTTSRGHGESTRSFGTVRTTPERLAQSILSDNSSTYASSATRRLG